MGGKTSAASKNAWIARNYDRIGIIVPKGRKAEIKARAESQGQSVNAFICQAIERAMSADNGKDG